MASEHPSPRSGSRPISRTSSAATSTRSPARESFPGITTIPSRALAQARPSPVGTANSDPTAYASGIRRRGTNATLFRPYDDFDDNDFNWPGWHPGSEPGFDPDMPHGGHPSLTALKTLCEITVVDISRERVDTRSFENDGFIDFMRVPQPAWAKCRWININGISWDVIQAVGKHKNLHKLAIEDIMNKMNRTKCDWYPNHAFMVMTLQKLVRMVDPDSSSDSDSDSDFDSVFDASSTSSSSSSSMKSFPGRSFRRLARETRRFFRATRRRRPSLIDAEKDAMAAAAAAAAAAGSGVRVSGTATPNMNVLSGIDVMPNLRSLQRYRASNLARSEFMERHSSLSSRGLAVSAEQVAIFLNSDNTVISFFELSADDVEKPIIKRLSTPGTILRQSCDASLIVQAIIDATIDLAVPLTAPSVKQSRSLYIIISEINKMLSFLNPIDNLVSVLRDHRTDMSEEQASASVVLQNTGTGVIVTPLTHTYLGDVLDQCLVVGEALQQSKQSAENLINLIFNTISAAQNETMKQLTNATIVFLPLTFLTGYFGMNFEPFDELYRGTTFFWIIAIPTVAAVTLVLMRSFLYSWGNSFVQRRYIGASRKQTKRQKKAYKRRNRTQRM
ncbi:unnamed protein product [Parascedosporium putredinis]|uniref:Uncharacterized protein n=1 Tax=Parascedosporium putredinis TaxID=1442378 RepID=A0A9P1H360_9PEZI|nr:unnamed protein product [Parascedosporium putredinis]CAI7994235.1 unnamed protein product [Parascedosporium putredinis]